MTDSYLDEGKWNAQLWWHRVGSLIAVTFFIEFMFYLYFIACIRCEGFLLDKKIGVNQPKRIEKARILVANTPMDADKIKVGIGENNRSLKKSIHSI